MRILITPDKNIHGFGFPFILGWSPTQIKTKFFTKVGEKRYEKIFSNTSYYNGIKKDL